MIPHTVLVMLANLLHRLILAAHLLFCLDLPTFYSLDLSLFCRFCLFFPLPLRFLFFKNRTAGVALSALRSQAEVVRPNNI